MERIRISVCNKVTNVRQFHARIVYVLETDITRGIHMVHEMTLR